MNYKRLILGLLCIVLLLTLMCFSFQEYDNNDVQIMKYKQVLKNTQNYTNSEISFVAEISSINNTSHTLRILVQEEPYTYPALDIYIGSVNISNLHKGDLVDIVGIIDGKNHITATKIWIYEQWKSDLIYLRSLLAIPFVLYLLLKTWKFNWKKFQFARRNSNS